MEQKKKTGRMVNTLTDIMHMRFSPEVNTTYHSVSGDSFIIEKIKSFLNRSLTAEAQPLDLSSEVEMNHSNTYDSVFIGQQKNRLKFLEKLTMQHVLIGNEHQLDLIDISMVHNKFVDTEYMWSLKCSAPIDYLTIDMKRLLIVIASRKEKYVQIFRYNHRKIYEKPIKIKSLYLDEEIKAICFLKEYLTIMTEKYLEIWAISVDDVVQRRNHAVYAKPSAQQFRFYTAPEPFQTTLNIFFQQINPDKPTFTLWLIEVEYTTRRDIKVGTPQKIYDIKKSLEKKITLKNFSKEFFLMNLGSEILTFKKGYVVDSAYINLKNEHSILKYNGDERLIHLSDRKFQIYSFTLNTKKKPYKINVSPIDAINITKPEESEYFNIIQVMNGNFMIVFQVKAARNHKTRGQLDYWFALTQKISLSRKVDLLFQCRSLSQYSKQQLLDKCDTAEKMGLKTKQIYLQLWSRSTKATDNDYLLLINTKDYETIQQQIVTKLRKSSISYTRIQKNQKLSLAMLQNDVFTNKCSLKILHNYVVSHFWLKKLKIFQLLATYEAHNNPQKQENPKQSKLRVSIQDFYQLKNLHIKNEIISLINGFCLEDKPVAYRIKFFLTHFRFVILMSYRKILEEVIKNTKGKIFKLLKEVPEILPYNPEDEIISSYITVDFNKGIWSDISKAEYQENLNIQKLKTDDNEKVVKELVGDIWFKQSTFESHGVVLESLQTIQKNLQFLKSEVTFYSVIQWIFENVREKQQRKAIFKYIQETYPLMPIHLKDRIILYHDIYHYLLHNNILPYKETEERDFTFHQFLAFQDHYLFHHLFQKQKEVKGLILKQIKPIYEDCNDQGIHFFNQNLAHFFKSDISTLSDLKYIFNRINNEKRQFHINNQEMYQVLVMTMGYKLMVGTLQDVPLEQILIYVENILIEKGKEILARLRVIKDINKNVDVLRKAKVNMSVEEIISNPHGTMGKMIDYFITKEKVRGQYNESAFLDKAYRILASIEYLYYEIYKDTDETSYFLFFLFLAKIAVDATSIPFIRLLLNDEYLEKQFHFDQSIAESLVLYMYKIKMSENPIYIQNEKYLRSLMTILPEDNEIRQFIICQFQFAKLLSPRPYVVEYPLSENQPSPALIELEYYLHKLKADYILSIDIGYLYELMSRMSELNSRIYRGLKFMEDDQKSSVFSSIFFDHNTKIIQRREVYEQFILRLLGEGLVRQTLPYVEKFLNESADNTDYDIIYPLILLIQAQEDINFQDRYLFRRAAAKFFSRPLSLFNVIKDYLLKALTNRQRTQLLKQIVQKSQSAIKGFNIENKLLSQQLIQIAQRQQLENSLYTLIENSFKQLEKNREEFGKMQYHFIFTMMTNSPYVVAKYMVCNKKFITIKNIRVFLTYLSKEDVFNPYTVLEYGRRLFLIVLYSLVQQKNIHHVVEMFADYPLDMDLPDSFTPEFDEQVSFFDRLWKSSEAFKNQKNKKRKEELNMSLEAKKKRYQQKLVNPFLIFHSKPIEYEQIIEDNEPQNAQYKDKPKNTKRISKQIDPSAIVKKLTKVKKQKSTFGNEQNDGKLQINVKGIEGGKNNEMFLNTESKRPSLNQNNEFCIKISEAQDNAGILGLEISSKPIQQIIKKSALSRKNSPEEESPGRKGDEIAREIKQLLELEEKNVFIPQIQEKQQKNLQKNKNSKNRRKRSNEVSYEQQSSDQQCGFEDDVVLKRKSHIDQKKDYTEIEGLPPVQEIGRALYKENLFNFEKKGKRIFQISDLKDIDTHPKFIPQYLQNLIKYLYYESESSSYIGIIHMIDYLIAMYPEVDIERKNLQIFVRGENMQNKYNLQLELRHVFPIEAVFEIKYNTEIIFEKMLPTIQLFIDNMNIFKMAKMIALTFQKAAIEDDLLYYQLKKILNNSEKKSKSQNIMESIRVFIDKLSSQMIVEKFEEIMAKINEEQSQSLIIEISVEKVQKKGTKAEKVRILQKVVTYDPSYKNLLKNMRKL